MKKDLCHVTWRKWLPRKIQSKIGKLIATKNPVTFFVLLDKDTCQTRKSHCSLMLSASAKGSLSPRIELVKYNFWESSRYVPDFNFQKLTPIRCLSLRLPSCLCLLINAAVDWVALSKSDGKRAHYGNGTAVAVCLLHVFGGAVVWTNAFWRAGLQDPGTIMLSSLPPSLPPLSFACLCFLHCRTSRVIMER